jgi:hypothetical protein
VRARWALLLALTLVVTAGPARAQPVPTDPARAARLVTLTVSTDTDDDVTQIVAYLRPLLEMRGFALAVRRVDSLDSAEPADASSQSGVRARVWLDLKTANQAQILFAAAERAPTGRVVPTAARIDEVAAAEISEIILAALLAPEGAFSAPAPSPPQLRSAPALAEPGIWQRSVGIVGAANSWADGAAAVPAVGLSVLLEWRPAAAAWSRALWSTLRYRPPFEPAKGPLGVRLRGAEGEVLAVIARRIARRASLGLAAGIGLDARFADITPPPAGTTVVNQRSVRELAPFLRTALRFDLSLDLPLSLFAALSLDLFPLQGRLVVQEAGATRAVFTPWPLRPGALGGASFLF